MFFLHESLSTQISVFGSFFEIEEKSSIPAIVPYGGGAVDHLYFGMELLSAFIWVESRAGLYFLNEQLWFLVLETAY